MLNHQKNAIRSQIKAVDSGNYPQLGVTLTYVGFDWNHRIKEYELYGALNLSIPLYDSGSSANKKRGLEYQIKMLLDREAALDSSKNTELNDLIDRTTKFNIEYKLSPLLRGLLVFSSVLLYELAPSSWLVFAWLLRSRLLVHQQQYGHYQIP